MGTCVGLERVRVALLDSRHEKRAWQHGTRLLMRAEFDMGLICSPSSPRLQVLVVGWDLMELPGRG